jgi:SOS-response transcriptional repressor LexA
MQHMAKKTLNSTQKQLLDLLKENPHESHTIREFQEILNLSTTSLVHHHLKQLEKKRIY